MKIHYKNRYLLFTVVCLSWLSYEMAIKPTILLKKKVNALEVKLQKQQFTQRETKRLLRQNSQYDTLLDQLKINETHEIQNQLVAIVNTFETQHKLKVLNFDQTHIYTTSETAVNTYAFSVQGSFVSLVRLLYALEQDYRIGQVTHVHFEKHKNYRNHQYYLTCKVYLQRVKQHIKTQEIFSKN